MDLFQILVLAGLALSVLFLLAGFSLSIFGTKTTNEVEGSSRIEFSIAGQNLSVPYHINVIMCVLGIMLLFLTFNFYSNSGTPNKGAVFISPTVAYAETISKKTFTNGWVYLGYEKDPRTWNFEIENGTFNELVSGNNGIILKSLSDLNIRSNHFGNFTGTLFNFLSPEPKLIGKLPEGTCVTVTNIKSVGFNKIWVEISPSQCP